MLKYKNTKVVYDGHKFDSKKEKDRYIQLSRMQEEGIISNLELQKRYELIPKNDKYRNVSYVADFRYVQKDGKEVIEDVKSKITAKDKVFLLKKKLFYHIFGKEISIFL